MTADVPAGEMTADGALQTLLAGNRRFVDGTRIFPDQSAARRSELVAEQKPFAAILSCSDSRVVPEIIFDQGLGDIFEVRVAGNVALGPLAASIEYAVQQLDVPLVMVLGHTGCGAIELAARGEQLTGTIAALAAEMEPALAVARAEAGPLVENAVRANVALNVDRLRSIHGAEVVGAVYDLASGLVELVD